MPASAEARRAALIAAALIAPVLGAVGAACRPVPAGDDAGAPHDAAAGTAPGATAAAPARNLYGSGPPSFTALVERARPALVAIRATTPIKSGPAAMFPGGADAVADVAVGTGFLVEARGVHVLTTDRIAAAAPSLVAVLADGSEHALSIAGRDPRLDIALLAFTDAASAPRSAGLAVGDSDELAVGEWLVVLGDAFGDGVTASAGIVSATPNGSLAAGPGQAFRAYLQTDARIHRGNAGGPVLDTAGRVVGVAVATGDRPTELSFAVPMNRVRDRLEALRDVGAVVRAWLGIVVQPVTPAQAAEVHLASATGALVMQVVAASPALKAGLQPGDIVLRWDGQAVDHRSLPWRAEAAVPGRAVTLTVWRAGAEKPVTVTPEKMPE